MHRPEQVDAEGVIVHICSAALTQLHDITGVCGGGEAVDRFTVRVVLSGEEPGNEPGKELIVVGIAAGCGDYSPAPDLHFAAGIPGHDTADPTSFVGKNLFCSCLSQKLNSVFGELTHHGLNDERAAFSGTDGAVGALLIEEHAILGQGADPPTAHIRFHQPGLDLGHGQEPVVEAVTRLPGIFDKTFIQLFLIAEIPHGRPAGGSAIRPTRTARPAGATGTSGSTVRPAGSCPGRTHTGAVGDHKAREPAGTAVLFCLLQHDDLFAGELCQFHSRNGAAGTRTDDHCVSL